MNLNVKVVAVVALVLAGTAACTEDQRDDAAEAVVRNVASTAAVGAFEAEGYEVQGNLDCEATSSGGAEQIELRCTGSADDGTELVLEGEAEAGTADGNAVRGSFVGTADGETVFEQECLGDDC